MSLIQPLLLGAFFVALFVYLRFFRSSVRDRLVGLLLFVTSCVAVLAPQWTQRVADFVGVGRGTDLTFYLFAVGFIFFAILTHSKLSSLSRALTEVIRRVAIDEGRGAGPSASAPPSAMPPSASVHNRS